MIRPRPMVSRIWFCGSAPSTLSMKVRCSRAPKPKSTSITTGTPRKGSSPSSLKRKYVTYIPTMSRSPCAKLMTRITPKMSVSPMPTRA